MTVTPLFDVLRNYFKQSDALFKSDLIGKTLQRILEDIEQIKSGQTRSKKVNSSSSRDCKEANKEKPERINSFPRELSMAATEQGQYQQSLVDTELEQVKRFASSMTLSKILRKGTETLFVFNTSSASVAFEASFYVHQIEKHLSVLPFKNIRVKITRS